MVWVSAAASPQLRGYIRAWIWIPICLSALPGSFASRLRVHAPPVSAAAAAAAAGGAPDPGHPSPAEISAFYINMPDRPARQAFAEAQYRALGIRAQRIEGTPYPNKTLGNLLSWQRAIRACSDEYNRSGHNGSDRFCLIAEDDAVYRPLNASEAKTLQEEGYPEWNKANLTADLDRFFASLHEAMEALPGGVSGQWTGLHLCTLGEMSNLAEDGDQALVLGNPWPHERFSNHAVYPGAPDVLLLRSRDADHYLGKLHSYITKVAQDGTHAFIDLLQSWMYTAEDAALEAGEADALRVFVTGNPQLCQHLTDYSNDPGVSSSIGDDASARS